jgi:serine/threonine protein kinase/Tol biopolymer transport system component
MRASVNLETGHKLGPYEIVSMIGAGGMGQVYRARDTRLDRTVAVKILPGGVASGAVLRARFEREARAIAALSHPNICAIHDVGSEDGIEYLVMEYLEGETLADRISRGPLPIQQVLRYGAQIAEALQQAHRSGITHRDLKPGNIMITPAGAKLLDFGLAKSVQEEVALGSHDAPTRAGPLTSEGTIVGTFQYMSPEQIEGRVLDPRTDIFALGIVLYEMTTGRRPFAAGSSAAVAAAILGSDPPPLRSVQPNAPPALERIIVTALEKRPDDRWQTAQDVARQLRWLAESSSTEQQSVARQSPRRALVVVGILAALGALATMAALLAGRTSPAPASPLSRLELSAPPGVSAVTLRDVNSFAIAPDGRALCFVGSQGGGSRAVFVRDFASYDAKIIQGSEGAFAPFWSPDGVWIGFSSGGKLWKTRRDGGSAPQMLCEVAVGGAVATWHGRTILFADGPDGRSNIFRISDEGGTPVAITNPSEAEWRHTWPTFIGDGSQFLYLSMGSRTQDRQVVLAAADGTKKGVLLQNVSQVRAVSADQLMYVRDGQLLVQKFDAKKGVVTGDPVHAGQSVAYFYPTAAADFDAVPAGVFVYRTETRKDTLSVFDRQGTETKVTDGTGRFFDVAFSPNATKAAVTVIDPGTGMGDIWLYDLARGVRDRITSDAGIEFSPVWSPDGRTLFHGSGQGGSVPYIVRRRLDGSEPQPVTARSTFRFPDSISPDGKTLFLVTRSARTKSDIYRLDLADGGEPEAMFASPFNELDPEVSTDGQWLAYTSDTTGRPEVFVQSLAPGGNRIRVSRDGGSSPRWRRDGRELLYATNDRRTVWSATTRSGQWDDAEAVTLFTTPQRIVDFAAFPDASRVLLIQVEAGPRDALFHVVTGWK